MLPAKRSCLTSILVLFLGMLTALVSSCSKHHVGQVTPDNNCIDRVIPQPAQTTLSPSQVDSISILFSNNNLSSGNLQFFTYIPIVSADLTVIRQEQVGAILFVDGLPVFNQDEVYMFDAGIFDTAYLYTGAPLTNDSSGHRTLPSLRSIFLTFVAQTFTESSTFPSPFPSPYYFNNKCLSATLGYLDAFYVPGSNQPRGVLIKVWKINPSDSVFPILYVRDDDGSAFWGSHIFGP